MSDPERIKKVMKSYEVEMPEGKLPIRYEFDWPQDSKEPDFYNTLKQRVQAHMKGRNHKCTWQKYMLRAFLFLCFLCTSKHFFDRSKSLVKCHS